MRSAPPGAAPRPVRTCVACRRTFAKPHLVRFGLVGDRMTVDPQGALAGRGCYVCDNPECLERALQRDGKRLRQALRVTGQRATVDVEALREAWRQTSGGIDK